MSASHKLNCARKLVNACEKPSDPIPASNLQKPGLFSINLDSRNPAGAIFILQFAIFNFQLLARHALFSLLLLAAIVSVQAQTKRVVILKVDGLPYEQVDKFARDRDPVTGKSRLPWFDYVFYDNGARVTNFYVRGMSLSAPSWSLVDTGQHLQIKGNVEFDRTTLHTYDYLNALSFYLKQAGRGNVDMHGTAVLDSVGVPILMDAYDNYQRLPGSQLYGRGARLMTLINAAHSKFLSNPRELATEFVTGLDMKNAVFTQYEHELIDRLNDPRVRYLDLLLMVFDHAAHHNNDRDTHLEALQELDGLVGRIWSAIQKSPMGAETALI